MSASSLSSQIVEQFDISDKAGGGIEPVINKVNTSEADLAAVLAADQKRLAAAFARSQARVKYPRSKGFGQDSAHVVPRNTAGASTRPGYVPWVRPSAKPEAWIRTQMDQEFVNNGPALPVPATVLLNQSLPYFVAVDPICETIRSTRPPLQDHGLYRHFDQWDESMSVSDSRPYTGHSSKSARTPRTPGTPTNSIQRPREPVHSLLPSACMPVGNPAAFKIKDFENVWSVDTNLLVASRQTLFGAHTARDTSRDSLHSQRPAPIRVPTSDSRFQNSVRSTRSPKTRDLTPRSPTIRELTVGMPRAIAKNRSDIPLVASQPGSRTPCTHGSMVPARPRTVNTTSNTFSASNMNARGMKYVDGSIHRVAPPSPKKTRTSTADKLVMSNETIPFVNLDTFDENFSSPQRLTPLSRRTLEKAGFDAGTLSWIQFPGRFPDDWHRLIGWTFPQITFFGCCVFLSLTAVTAGHHTGGNLSEARSPLMNSPLMTSPCDNLKYLFFFRLRTRTHAHETRMYGHVRAHTYRRAHTYTHTPAFVFHAEMCVRMCLYVRVRVICVTCVL